MSFSLVFVCDYDRMEENFIKEWGEIEHDEDSYHNFKGCGGREYFDAHYTLAHAIRVNVHAEGVPPPDFDDYQTFTPRMEKFLAMNPDNKYYFVSRANVVVALIYQLLWHRNHHQIHKLHAEYNNDHLSFDLLEKIPRWIAELDALPEQPPPVY